MVERWLLIRTLLWWQTAVNVHNRKGMTGPGLSTEKILLPNHPPFPFGFVVATISHSCRPDPSSCAAGRLDSYCLGNKK